MAKHIRYVFLFAIIGILFYTYLFYSEKGSLPRLSEHFWILVGAILFANLAGYAIRFIHAQLDRIMDRHSNLASRFGISILINFIMFPLCALLLFLIFRNLTPLNPNLSAFINQHFEVVLRFMVLSLVFGFIYTVVDFSFFSYNHYSVVQIETERQLRKQVELQFEALKTQLSPHYLFNSLNTISLLIYKDANLTEEFIRKLAQTYEYILKSNEKKLITVEEELKFINSYAYSLKVRYEEGFNLEEKVDAHVMQFVIPPLSLQILVENAVKHNALSNEEPLHISIRNEQMSLVVENNILKKPNTNHSFKIGHSNIIKRYQYFTSRKVSISKSKTCYKVSIPILES